MGALLALACSGTTPAPVITAKFVSFDRVSVSWGRSAVGFTNLVVEGRTLPGAFQVLISVAESQQFVDFDLAFDTPELSDLEFRMTGVASDGTHSSNVVSLHRGVRPPLLGCDIDFLCRHGAGGFRLFWRNESRVADRYVLTRRILTLDGAISDEVTLPISDGATERIDPDDAAWVDGATYSYALTAYKGETPSETSHVNSEPAPLITPLVSGESTGQGVVLTIENRSRYAPMVEVFRKTESEEHGTLIAQTSMPGTWNLLHMLDPGLAPGAYQYEVRVVYVSTPSFAIQSNFALPWVVVSPAGPGTVEASQITLAGGFFAARGPAGDFSVVADSLPSEQLGRVIIPNGRDGSNALVLPWPSTVSHAVLDTQGQPHAVYVEVPPGPWDGSPIPIVHTWYDGQSWRNEEIAKEAVQPARLGFDMGPDGTLHVAWIGDQMGVGMVVGVATHGNAAWQLDTGITDLSVANSWKWDRLLLAGDETGAPHLILQIGDWQPKHFSRDQAGWHFDDVPQPSDLQFPIALLAGRGRVTYLTNSLNTITRIHTLMLLERDASGWSSPLALASNGADFSYPVLAARSADGQRIALATPGSSWWPGPGTLWIREANGTMQTYEWFWKPQSNFATGFSANGKAWVLNWLEDGLSSPPGAKVPAVVFNER